jgi:hypothetical protein
VVVVLLEIQSNLAFQFGNVPGDIIPCIPILPRLVLFFYPKTIFAIPNDLQTPTCHSYEVWPWKFLVLRIEHIIFFHIYYLVFYLKKIFLSSNSEKILWKKYLKVPPCRNLLFWKPRWPLLHMRPWTLNLDYMTFSFLYFVML